MPLSDLPLDELGRRAREHHLIAAFEVAGSRVRFRYRDDDLDLDPEEARYFLSGLLRGHEHAQAVKAGRRAPADGDLLWKGRSVRRSPV